MADEPYSCDQVVPIEDEPRHHLIIANEYVRAFAVEIPSRDRTLCHHHPNDYFLYVARGTAIISAAQDEDAKRLNYGDGECELAPAGLIHVVENLGERPFRNVVVELLERGRNLRRGQQPLVMAGTGKVETALQEVPGAVFSIELQPGCEVEISGPAVLAAPYQPVMMKEIDDFDIPLDEFRKLVWVCAPRKVWIKNPGAMPARVISFQVGTVGGR